MIRYQKINNAEKADELLALTLAANEGHTSWTAESFAFELESDRSLYMVAMNNDSIVGYVGCMTVLDEGSLSNICVHPDFQNKGIGRTLLQNVLEEARIERIQTIYLEVRVSNQAAIALYEAVGFVKIGTRTQYYSNPLENADLYQMELRERVEE